MSFMWGSTQMTVQSKRYVCPKHGKNGIPECSICWENLEAMCRGENIYLTGDNVND